MKTTALCLRTKFENERENARRTPPTPHLNLKRTPAHVVTPSSWLFFERETAIVFCMAGCIMVDMGYLSFVLRIQDTAPVSGGHSSRVGGHSSRVGGHNSRVGGRNSRVGGRSFRVGGHSSCVGGHSSRVGGQFSI